MNKWLLISVMLWGCIGSPRLYGAEKWVEQVNEFTFQTARQMETAVDPGRSVCSPLGIVVTLDLMREGAAGETRRQIGQFLPRGGREEEIARTFASIQQTGSEEFLFGAALDANDGYGMKTLRVAEGTPAETSGLERGDLIFEIDGETISSSENYNAAIDKAAREIALVYFDRSAQKLVRKTVTLEVINNDDSYGDVVLASAIWHREGFALNPAFTEAIQQRTAAQVRTLPSAPDDAAAALNAWSSEWLRESVTPFAPDQLDAAVELLATNLVSVSGQWDEQFDRQKTSQKPFLSASGQSVPVEMMTAEQQLLYGEHAGWKSVVLPMKQGACEVLFLLPPERNQPELPSLDMPLYNRLNNSMGVQRVDLQLPRVAFESRHADVASSLRKLGLTLPFDRVNADFSRLSGSSKPETYIAEFFQQASFRMDEYGARATAVTAAISKPRFAVEGQLREFHANRPFRFLIRDTASGLILFTGHLSQPDS